MGANREIVEHAITESLNGMQTHEPCVVQTEIHEMRMKDPRHFNQNLALFREMTSRYQGFPQVSIDDPENCPSHCHKAPPQRYAPYAQPVPPGYGQDAPQPLAPQYPPEVPQPLAPQYPLEVPQPLAPQYPPEVPQPLAPQYPPDVPQQLAPQYPPEVSQTPALPYAPDVSPPGYLGDGAGYPPGSLPPGYDGTSQYGPDGSYIPSPYAYLNGAPAPYYPDYGVPGISLWFGGGNRWRGDYPPPNYYGNGNGNGGWSGRGRYSTGGDYTGNNYTGGNRTGGNYTAGNYVGGDNNSHNSRTVIDINRTTNTTNNYASRTDITDVYAPHNTTNVYAPRTDNHNTTNVYSPRTDTHAAGSATQHPERHIPVPVARTQPRQTQPVQNSGRGAEAGAKAGSYHSMAAHSAPTGNRQIPALQRSSTSNGQRRR